MVASAATIGSRLTADEFILVLATIIPISIGLVAAFQTLTGIRAANDELDGGTVATEAAIRASNSNTQATVYRMEQQIVDLQQAHETRFADLHKDLAGVVWELSKLRADMARWQVG